MKFDRNKHSFVAVDPTTREQLFVPLSELGQMVVKEVERVEVQAQPADIGPIRKELSEKMAQVFQEIQAEFSRQLAATRAEFEAKIRTEFRRSWEALMVTDATERGIPIDPGGFPALSTMLSEQGTDVTSEAIVAAADHIAREQLEAARAT